MRKVTQEIIDGIKKRREEDGLALGALVQEFNLSKSTIYEIIKSLDDSKVIKASPSRKVVAPTSAPVSRPQVSKTELGEAARQITIGRLLLAGIKVFQPICEDTTIDLLAYSGSGVPLKCQCKVAWYCPKTLTYKASLCTTRKNGPNSKAEKHRYTEEEVDFFFIYCLENDGIYVIPNKDTEGRHELVFWILRDKIGNCGKEFDTSIYLNRFDLLKSGNVVDNTKGNK